MTKPTFKQNNHFKSLLTEISKHAKRGRILEKDEDPNALPTDDIEGQPVDQTQPTVGAPEPTSEPAAEDAPETEESPEEVEKDANLAKAKLEKAKSEKSAAEEELDEVGHIKIVSDDGAKILLQLVIDPSIKTNQIDSLAKKLVDKLNIKDIEDFKSFKDETVQFNSINGFNQLVQSMESFVGVGSGIGAGGEETEE